MEYIHLCRREELNVCIYNERRPLSYLLSPCLAIYLCLPMCLPVSLLLSVNSYISPTANMSNKLQSYHERDRKGCNDSICEQPRDPVRR